MNISYLNIGTLPAKLYSAENAHGTVLAIHGFGGSKESGAIAGLAERVTADGLNVLSFDLPAHGERDGGAEQLDPRGCIKEILVVEEYIKEHFIGEMYAFATSFGAMCLLHRMEKLPDCFRKIVLRVPAVSMADALLAISMGQDSSLALEKAKEKGFRVTIGREYNIPYRFYEELMPMSCLRTSDVWNSSRILTVYAENDELVSPHDTEEFLRLNPLMRSLCIKGCTHRMPVAEHMAQALDAAAEFFVTL